MGKFSYSEEIADFPKQTLERCGCGVLCDIQALVG